MKKSNYFQFYHSVSLIGTDTSFGFWVEILEHYKLDFLSSKINYKLVKKLAFLAIFAV